MTRRDRLAREAVAAALRLRVQAGRSLDAPVCPFDLAETIGVTVRMEPLSSLEGMYSPDGPNIVVGSLRPLARRTFTCGHELGHHVLGHGLRVDELLEQAGQDAPRGDDEYAADRFAAALLMPKLAVSSTFARRGWTTSSCTAEQAYVAAGVLGIGYTTLVGYLHHTLGEIKGSDAHRLQKERTSTVRKRLLGFAPPKGLLVVDEQWSSKPADVEVGDCLLLPRRAQASGDALVVDQFIGDRVLARAVRPGHSEVSTGGALVNVRVSRVAFRGLAVYRYLEDADDE